MLTIPCTRELWAEAYRNPELGRAFDAEIRREHIRYNAWQSEYERCGAGGVSCSGLGPGPFEARTPEQMLQAARDSLSRRKAFEETPEGRVVGVLRRVDELTLEINMAAGKARAARDRSFAGELPRLDALLKEMEVRVRELKLAVLDGQLAVDDAYAAAEAQGSAA